MEKDKILTQLAKEWGQFPQQENELTVTDIIEAISGAGATASEAHIQRKLKKLVKENLLVSRKINSHSGGGQRWVYSPVEGKTWKDVLQYLKNK